MYAHYQLLALSQSVPLYTTLNSQSLQDKLSKKVRDVSNGEWGGGGLLKNDVSRNVHMTFLVDKIGM